MTKADQFTRPLRAEEIPAAPASVDEATQLSELLDDDALPRFAMTFDGYAHFGEHWGEILQARREEFDREGTLPRDVDALRGLLFLTYRQERFVELDDTARITAPDGTVTHEPDPQRITDGRRRHERFKHALLAKMRTLAAEQADGAPRP